MTLRNDANGNLVWDGLHGYDYDCANELTRVTLTNAWKTEYAYDGFGRRRVRKEFTWSGGSWAQTNEVHYVYDGMVVIQERDSNNVPLVSYTRGVDLSGTMQGAGGIGGLLARTDASGNAFYHADGNGNITAMMDGAGNEVSKYLYDSYGNMLGMWGSLAPANTYRYSSKEIDARSGLYYYGYRYYEPNFQRWPNRDPIEEDGGINLYEYVGNNPINFYDPYGLYSWGEWGQIVGAGTVGAGQGLAAAGDGALPFVSPFADLGLYDPNDPTLQDSQKLGAVASVCLSGAGALKAAGISSRIALHGAHHEFPPLGRLPHVQLNWWRAGVKGSGGAVRVPVPPGTPGFPK